ncbi:hypothetical protein lacNasYZ03_00100 [Lactobacillus nasalidis]|uniref:SDR family NAD(P)-dependent oxidoreductase n=1 Tax=Lactobacillus nasalidis TaxID=2797258 RepID=A0ABQ3W254_9LACO|nr:SDR family NAD(P)-dependent oxidoreductase [Lactobacillus nasalidis]GHV97467.1 hypothetical protein lacNasYZ01_06490 [Lactobacillus nasalidis]GHV99518.1 hypothetical protein lacNasYZ02_09480 [Lactobacillus nasalidis]GHW00323.1 hypothetical protein lacNasYZ03_00100 [Lactobacillus nasalidis]
MSKVIVITGASSGIGEASAKVLAEQGNKVVLAARREDRLKKLADEIKAAGGEAIYVLTDVAKMDEVLALGSKAVATYGRIDVWINCAGLMPLSELAKGKPTNGRQRLTSTLRGPCTAFTRPCQL